MVLNFLKKEKNISEDDEKLAIWLNEKDIKDRNIEDISKNNGIQDYLIFKQAIAIGWDCPRAQILLKFREIKSEVFEIQVLGRILRTPEQKHYEIESLNKAYVYVNSDEVSFDIENYNPKILGDLPSTRKELYKDISLNSFYKERADYQDIKSDFKTVLQKQFTDELGLKTGDYDKNINKLKKDNWKFDRDELYHNVISDIMVEISSIDKYDTPLEDDDYETLNVSDRQIEITSKGLFKSMMAPFTNIARSVPSMNVAWFVLCQNMFGSVIIKDNFVSSQSLLILNRSKIEPLFIRAVQEYSKVKKQKAKEDTEKDVIFDVPVKDYFNSQVVELLDYKKYILNPCYLDKSRSNPEKEFENELNNSKKITWWYKNGVNRKDYFGIKYEYDNKDGQDITHTFYPDYIVQFEDGRIGIFETKSKSDQDAHTKTKAKSEELYKYMQNENKKGGKLFGGIVVFKDNEWQINSEKEYSFDKNWKKLDL
jgi:type III restriction enzyme